MESGHDESAKSVEDEEGGELEHRESAQWESSAS